METMTGREFNQASSEARRLVNDAPLFITDRGRPAFFGRILAVDEKVALCCAGLHVPDRRPFLDSLVAATALAHDLTPVTRHVRDFEGTGGKLIDPWKPNC